MKTYMIEFELPDDFSEEFMALIPRQRAVINQMLAEGIVQHYSLSIDRGKLWVVMYAESRSDLTKEMKKMPLFDFMVPDISPLMFHNSASEIMEFSLN